MTLTVVVGASGSGKTTFLGDVHKFHKCIYIRQYHQLRPYLIVKKIPNFDPTALPFWDIYETEEKADKIQIGGTMAGQFTAGLSGGQRKMLLFELIYQRTREQKDLLICLDEPFAGVTDDFIPWITQRLKEMQQNHNILMVTNDHVQALMDLSDNVLTVSAIDRAHVKVNDREEPVARDQALHALSLGEEYKYSTSNADLKFFWDAEVASNKALLAIFISIVVYFAMFIATFWDPSPGSEGYVLIGGGIITYFCIQPYLLSLCHWRNINKEEGDAIMHSSVNQNKLMKTGLSLLLTLIIDVVYFGCINLVTDTLSDPKFFVGIVFDIAALTFPMIFIGIYTNLTFEAVQILGGLPFLSMIFFSTTFAPGAGVPGLKALRFLFARFYFWCMVPGLQDDMEGCPADNNLLYLVLTSLIFSVVFFGIRGLSNLKKKAKQKTVEKERNLLAADQGFLALQEEFYGKTVMKRLSQTDSGTKDIEAE